MLAEEPGREMVVGAVTRPWAPVVRFRGLPTAEFVAFTEPSFTKIAWNIAARPAGSGCSIVSTETRVAATDPFARRRFRRYWLLFSPAIKLIRRVGLRMVRRELEAKRAAAALKP